jgi:chaperonin cofactor prefoldin
MMLNSRKIQLETQFKEDIESIEKQISEVREQMSAIDPACDKLQIGTIKSA